VEGFDFRLQRLARNAELRRSSRGTRDPSVRRYECRLDQLLLALGPEHTLVYAVAATVYAVAATVAERRASRFTTPPTAPPARTATLSQGVHMCSIPSTASSENGP
jgi:hypothetical protein